MKLHKIEVKENKQLLSTGEFQYNEVEVRIYDLLDFVSNTYIMQEYSRERKTLLRIGVKLSGAGQVIAKDAWGNKINLTPSDHDSNLWYDSSQSWMENGYETTKETIFGSNSCGEWEIVAYRIDGSFLDSVKVRIIPSLLSDGQYRVMQLEIKKIIEDLSYRPGQKDNRVVVRELQMPLFPIEKIQSLINDWIQWLNQIEANPAEILFSLRERKTIRQMKKWDRKAIIEHAMFPERERLSAKVTIKENHVPEHGMIKWMLERTIERIVQERSTEAFALQQLIENRKELIDSFSSIGENKRISETLDKRIRRVEKDMVLLTERNGIWLHLEKLIETYLNSDLFDTVELEPEWTHLFSSDPKYYAVFEIHEKMSELVPTLTPREREFEQALTNSPHLFEVWMLLQLIRELERLQFVCEDIIGSLVSHFHMTHSLSGWSGRFKNRDEVVGLYYEPELMLADGKLVKPDYLLLVKNSTGTWHAHTLDAKYKPYFNMDKKVLEKDIERSCRRYLNIVKDKIIMKSAALVHMDQRTCNWNIEKKVLYSLSHFHVVPGNTDGLKIYIKRIFHYFGKRLNKCPSCGEDATCIDQKFYKQTYICEACNEVWVNNTCKKKYHPNSSENVSLLKYASGNFNIRVGNEWNVYCPACSRDANGQVINLDIFGRTIDNIN
ncbi:nuclease domain-containing protein [Paenibacillus sp. GYB006]|uniref:nuclease domain-containing protein n=1 Tax=Paenibacillus sp. GYB006 TaxID=2994394 RepID=UPI002F96506D